MVKRSPFFFCALQFYPTTRDAFLPHRSIRVHGDHLPAALRDALPVREYGAYAIKPGLPFLPGPITTIHALHTNVRYQESVLNREAFL